MPQLLVTHSTLQYSGVPGDTDVSTAIPSKRAHAKAPTAHTPSVQAWLDPAAGVDRLRPAENVFGARVQPYRPGPYNVGVTHLPKGAHGSPMPLDVYRPRGAGPFPVVVFEHGFMGRANDCSELLRHLASQGFAAVAPQNYGGGAGSLSVLLSVDEEAERLESVLDWCDGGLADLLPGAVDAQRLALIGFSRGGRAAYTVAGQSQHPIAALVLLDPTDGAPEFVEGRRADEVVLPQALPTLVLGMGLSDNALPIVGAAMAPSGKSHELYFDSATGPAWHVVAPDYGHLDSVDRPSSPLQTLGRELLARAGVGRSPRNAGARQLAQGVVCAFMRKTVCDEPGFERFLTDPKTMPITARTEQRQPDAAA